MLNGAGRGQLHAEDADLLRRAMGSACSRDSRRSCSRACRTTASTSRPRRASTRRSRRSPTSASPKATRSLRAARLRERVVQAALPRRVPDRPAALAADGFLLAAQPRRRRATARGRCAGGRRAARGRAPLAREAQRSQRSRIPSVRCLPRGRAAETRAFRPELPRQLRHPSEGRGVRGATRARRYPRARPKSRRTHRRGAIRGTLRRPRRPRAPRRSRPGTARSARDGRRLRRPRHRPPRSALERRPRLRQPRAISARHRGARAAPAAPYSARPSRAPSICGVRASSPASIRSPCFAKDSTRAASSVPTR